MNIEADYIIVGSGLTGAVIARSLCDAGREVVVLERRDHVGGNVHDHVHPCGIRIHTYGPHYFRTSSDRIWEFVNRFAQWYEYRAIVKSWVDGAYENWPIAGSYIRRVCGKGALCESRQSPANFEEAALSIMPRVIYEKFVRGYTEKQWGTEARRLSAGLVKRFSVQENDEPYLMTDKYQGLPVEGYAGLMRNVLRGVPVVCNCDYLADRNGFRAKRLLVFTGAIDEFYDCDIGRLGYRAQKRNHTYYPGAGFLQPCGQVNNPDPAEGEHIRTLEWKHMMQRKHGEKIVGTVLTQEIPYTPKISDEYEYPFPDRLNAALYERYALRAKSEPKLLICGRLGEYRYYDMDQAIGRALTLADAILAQ